MRGEDDAEDGRRRRLDIHACLASTGEYLAIVRLPPSSTVSDLCRAVAEEASLSSRGPCTYHPFFGGRFLEGQTPLLVAGFRNRCSVDFVRCRPQSIMTVASEGTAKVFNAETGLCALTVFSPRTPSPARCLHWAQPGPLCCSFAQPDGARAVVWERLGATASVRRTADGEVLATIVGHCGAINAAVFSREGFHVATASSDNTSAIWNARTGERLKVLEGHRGAVTSLAFSPDGLRLVTASEDGTAKVWCVASGTSILTLAGHKWAATAAAFSWDGQHVATASEDRTAKVWSAETGECLVTFEGHDGPVVEVAFSGCWKAERT